MSADAHTVHVLGWRADKISGAIQLACTPQAVSTWQDTSVLSCQRSEGKDGRHWAEISPALGLKDWGVEAAEGARA